MKLTLTCAKSQAGVFTQPRPLPDLFLLPWEIESLYPAGLTLGSCAASAAELACGHNNGDARLWIVSKGEVRHSALRAEMPVASRRARSCSRSYLDVRSRVAAFWPDDRAVRNVLVGAVVIAAHALAIAPLLVGDAQSAVPQRRLGAVSVIHGVILEVASVRPFLREPPLSAPALRPIDFGARSRSHAHRRTTAHADPVAGQPGLAVLYGRYLGQIQARIERAWLRPRSAIGGDLFRCQVRIDQGRSGAVGDITLQRCNGTVQWQESLVRAIEDASPLSAPPNPAVFTSHVVLVFRSTGYTQEAPSGQFQPAAAPVVREQRATVVALTRIRALRQPAVARFGKDAVIELDITGSRVHVVRKH